MVVGVIMVAKCRGQAQTLCSYYHILAVGLCRKSACSPGRIREWDLDLEITKKEPKSGRKHVAKTPCGGEGPGDFHVRVRLQNNQPRLDRRVGDKLGPATTHPAPFYPWPPRLNPSEIRPAAAPRSTEGKKATRPRSQSRPVFTIQIWFKLPSKFGRRLTNNFDYYLIVSLLCQVHTFNQVCSFIRHRSDA